MSAFGVSFDWSVAAWVGMVLKGGVVLAGAGLTAAILPRSSASTRHLVWTVALVSLPVLTVLSFMGSGWQWSMPVIPVAVDEWIVDSGPRPDAAAAAADPPLRMARVTPGSWTGGGPSSVPPVAEVEPSTPDMHAGSGRTWMSWLGMVWVVAAGSICLPLVAGLVSLIRVRRTARELHDDGWRELMARSCRDLGLSRRVRLLEHDLQTMPMTWGTIHPAVLMPAESRAWTEEKRRAVLLHELAHVQRFDYLTRILARLGLALHLFNPLAWMAWRRMRSESEQACDDRVLAAGADPATYADQLLQIAQHGRVSPSAAAASITMARRSQLEGRILSILDAARNRTGMDRARVAACLALTALVILPVSAVRLVAQPPGGEPPMRHYVRIVLGADTLSFEGESIDWTEVESRLAAVINRPHTVLELAMATDEISLREWNEARARARHLSRAYGFEYLSEVGLHPLDSQGSDSEPRAVSEASLATQRDQYTEAGDLLAALGAEMRRVRLRSEKGHAYKDKVALDGVWEAYRDQGRPATNLVRSLMEKVEQWGAGFAEDPEYPWRVAHLMSVMARDAGDPAAALAWMDRALTTYPETRYSAPSKHSKFQHLVNAKADLLWDADDPGVAAQDALGRFLTDPRFEFFFLPWWEATAARKEIEDDIEELRRLVLQGYLHRMEAFPERAELARGYLLALARETDPGRVPEAVRALMNEDAEPASGPIQQRIDRADAGDTVTLPNGTHRETVVINKALTLRGSNSAFAMIKVRADRPAIEINTSEPVVIENLTIEWQRASSGNPSGPLAGVVAGDGPLTIARCQFSGDAGYARCPSAVQVNGFAELELRECVFDGFEFAVQVNRGAQGLVEDCVFVAPGHCGLTVGQGAEVTARRNLVTGSLFHGMRCTGGTLNAEDNVIVANKNRGIYLGNRAAHGLVANNLILGNATGISAFGGSDTTIRNNVIMDNSFAAIDSRSLCPITVEANVLQGNNQGLVVWEESAAPAVIRLGGNTFWANASNDVLRIDLPSASVVADAGFADTGAGDFTRPGALGRGAEHGLARPESLRPVWEKWAAVSALAAE